MKINGNTVGTPTPRTNYNQTNPKKADYLVGRENILGKDELTSATEEALRQAKESGEFDGADGVSCTHSWNGTTLTVTSASGTSSADLKGEKGDPGLGGTVNGEVPNEDGDILLYGPMGYEPKVTLAQSDMSRYLYLGADKNGWMTTPEDVTIRASFRNGAVVDFKTDGFEFEVDYNSTSYAVNFNGATIWAGVADASIPVNGKVGIINNGDSNFGGYTGAFVAEKLTYRDMASVAYENNMSSTAGLKHIRFESVSSFEKVNRGVKFNRVQGTGRTLLIDENSPSAMHGKVKLKVAGAAYEAGVVFRYVDENNYSYAFVNWDGKLIHIRQVINGEEIGIATSVQVGDYYHTNSGLNVVDVASNHLSASIYTVAGDKKLYAVFNQKVRVAENCQVCVVPIGHISNSHVVMSDYVVSFDSTEYNLANTLKNGPHYPYTDENGNVINQSFVMLWGNESPNNSDRPIIGEDGSVCENDYVAYFWDDELIIHKFDYAGEVGSIADIPSITPSKYDQAMMSVGNDDMYICMGDDYLVQTVLRNFGVNTKSTYIIVKEELATTVSSVTILLGDDIIATLTQNDIASAFLGKRDTPSFDWLTSRYEVRFTVDGEVMGDLGVNGFDKSKNFISAYSSIGCFISGVNGLTGYGESNEYCVIINPAVASINQVEIGSEPWKKIPHGAFPTDDVVRGGSVNLIESGAVKTYVDNMVEVKTKELKAYFDLIEERLLALAKAIGKEGE